MYVFKCFYLILYNVWVFPHRNRGCICTHSYLIINTSYLCVHPLDGSPIRVLFPPRAQCSQDRLRIYHDPALDKEVKQYE